MHKAPEIGVVREGMLADMVIVDQNPLQNFKVLYANGAIRLNDKTGKVERVGGIKWTIKDGIAYDAKKLAADVQAMVEKQKRERPAKTTTASPRIGSKGAHMRRALVLAWASSSRSAPCRSCLPGAAAATTEVVDSRESQGQPVHSEGRRRQQRRLRRRERRDRGRRQESRLGQADSRQDQGAHAQAGDAPDQHAHARRSCERQRGLPGDRRHRRPGEHENQHGEDADLQGERQRAWRSGRSRTR